MEAIAMLHTSIGALVLDMVSLLQVKLQVVEFLDYLQFTSMSTQVRVEPFTDDGSSKRRPARRPISVRDHEHANTSIDTNRKTSGVTS